jgi:hypothetical protein
MPELPRLKAMRKSLTKKIASAKSPPVLAAYIREIGIPLVE